MTPINKAIAGAVVSAIAGGGTATATLPPDTPWWGYLLAWFLSGLLGLAGVYFSPANKPSATAAPATKPTVAPPAAVIGFVLLLPLLASLGACSTTGSAGQVSASRQAFAAACVALVGTDEQSGAVATATKLEAAGELKASIAGDLNTAFHALVPICTDPSYAAAASDATLSEKASEINATVATVQANGG